MYDLFWYFMKHALTKIEKACIIEYQLQVYLIELFQIKRKHTSFDKLVDFVLSEIRSDCKYWLEKSDIYNEIYNDSEMDLNLNLEKRQ